MKSLMNFIMEGRKQKLADPKSFIRNLRSKYDHKQPEYYKVMTDFLVDEILWKYPEIGFSNLRTTDIKMGYSDIPAKSYCFEYVYNGHVLGFNFNNYFANPFCCFKMDNKNVTHDISGQWVDFDFMTFLCNKRFIDKYKSLLDALA